jgi:hypothetical protein
MGINFICLINQPHWENHPNSTGSGIHVESDARSYRCVSDFSLYHPVLVVQSL